MAALALVLLACGGTAERFRPLAVGEPVPRYAARTLAGDSARVGSEGEPLTLLNIWATWCAPCRAEFPELDNLHQEYSARGLRVLAVSVDDGGDSAVESFVREQGARFVIGRDAQGRVQRLFQTVGVPESFLISGDGKLVWRHFGAIPEGAPELRRVIDGALGR
jgi:thiol-disulfide isomerase/thioredoxin